MTEHQSKIRALFLAGLMVMSVFAMTMAFTGSAAAAATDRQGSGTTSWDTADGSGNVGAGAVLFQGEDEGDITWTGAGSFSTFERDSGSNDGEPLDLDDEDAIIGSYTNGGSDTITVDEPEINNFDIRINVNDADSDIAGGEVPSSQDTLQVYGDYNYYTAEDLEITVMHDGTDVTDEIVDESDQSVNPNDQGNTSAVAYTLDISDSESGQYSVTLEGGDDLDHSDATDTKSFNISTADDIQLGLGTDEVVKGENVDYDISGGLEGDFHIVRIDGDLDASDEQDVFRNIATVDSVASNDDDGVAYAIVEIDGGLGEGGIDSEFLDATEVTVEVSESITFDPDTQDADNIVPGNWEYEDEVTLDVTEGEIDLQNPTEFYVPGADTTLNGTVSDAYDDVKVFVRDQGEYQRVGVSGLQVTDGEFEAEDVDLTDDPTNNNYEGNRILNYPGSYRFAVVAGGTEVDVPAMSASELNQNVSDVVSLRVTDAELEANASIINGQLSTTDGLDVSGVAAGQEEVSVTFFGPRGSVGAASSPNVDSDGTFEAEDIPVQQPFFPNNLAGGNPVTINKGTVIMSVSHPGRDGVSGDGDFPDRFQQNVPVSSQGQRIAFLAGLHPDPGNYWAPGEQGRSFTQQQAIEYMSSEGGSDAGSDDQSVAFQFRLTDPRSSIESVTGEAGVNGMVQVGSQAEISGSTNLQPEDNVITIEAIDGPSSQQADVVTTDSWGTDGQWNVTMNTTGLEPGNYTLEASTGVGASDVMSVTLTEDDVGTATPTETAEPTETATEEPTETETMEQTETEAPETTEGDTGPGFGVIVALVALVAAALLAVRRNN